MKQANLVKGYLLVIASAVILASILIALGDMQRHKKRSEQLRFFLMA